MYWLDVYLVDAIFSITFVNTRVMIQCSPFYNSLPYNTDLDIIGHVVAPKFLFILQRTLSLYNAIPLNTQSIPKDPKYSHTGTVMYYHCRGIQIKALMWSEPSSTSIYVSLEHSD